MDKLYIVHIEMCVLNCHISMFIFQGDYFMIECTLNSMARQNVTYVSMMKLSRTTKFLSALSNQDVIHYITIYSSITSHYYSFIIDE